MWNINISRKQKESKENPRVYINEGNSEGRRTQGFATLKVTLISSILLGKHIKNMPLFILFKENIIEMSHLHSCMYP